MNSFANVSGGLRTTSTAKRTANSRLPRRYARWSCPVAAIAAALLAGCPQDDSGGEFVDSGSPVSGASSDPSRSPAQQSPTQSPPASSPGSSAPDTGGASAGQGSTGGDAPQTGFVDSPVLASIPTNPPVPNLPGGALRIVTLGDSLTEGIGDESGAAGGYPRRLLEAVGQLRAGSTVLNLGKSGWSSTDLLEGMSDQPNQIDAAVAAQPDIACLWIGSNDLFALYEYGPESGTTRDLEAEDLVAYAANIETLLSRLEQTGAALYVALLDDQSLRPVLDDRATLPFTTAAERAQMSRQVIRYNNVLIAAAQRHGATLVDFYHTTIFTSAETLDFDGIHPNAAGYDTIADKWYAAMLPAISR